MIDDVLIHGSTQEEHDQLLVRQNTVTRKCKFSKSNVRFLGQMLDSISQGIYPDLDKVKAMR